MLYLSWGDIVLKSSRRTELRDALRFLSDFSVGTHIIFTVWPGKYGHVVVVGSEGS